MKRNPNRVHQNRSAKPAAKQGRNATNPRPPCHSGCCGNNTSEPRTPASQAASRTAVRPVAQDPIETVSISGLDDTRMAIANAMALLDLLACRLANGPVLKERDDTRQLTADGIHDLCALMRDMLADLYESTIYIVKEAVHNASMIQPHADACAANHVPSATQQETAAV